MVGKRNGAYRSMHSKNAKRVMSSGVGKRGQRPEPAPSPFLCGKCGFQGLDAYDISTHLRNNSYCCIIMNNPIAIPAAASITRVESPPPEEGDSFMCNDYDGSSSEDMNSCASPLGIRRKTPEDSFGRESSSSLDEEGEDSISSFSTDHLDNFDSFDPFDEEEDSDTSCNGYEFYEEETFPAGVDDVVHVGLAQLCRKIKAPLYAYNEILHWAQSAKVQGYSFPADAPHYRTFLASLKKRLNVEDYAHKTSTVNAPGGGTVSFPVFQFESMFLSLMDDPRIKDHLLLNWDDPSSPPTFVSGSLDEIHSGMWHQRTSAKLLRTNSNEVLCGIILAVDRTHVADKDKLSLEPVLFSLSIVETKRVNDGPHSLPDRLRRLRTTLERTTARPQHAFHGSSPETP